MTQFTPHGVTPMNAGAPSQPAPPVIFWFKAYSVAMALLYLLVIGLGIFFFFLGTIDDQEIDTVEMFIMGTIMVGLGLVLLGVYVAAIFLPRKPWVWIYDIVMIAIGLTSCLTMAAAIPLLIYWIKPEVQQYFGRNVPSPPR